MNPDSTLDVQLFRTDHILSRNLLVELEALGELEALVELGELVLSWLAYIHHHPPRNLLVAGRCRLHH